MRCQQPINMSEKSTRVGVALVNWNSGEYTIPCIQSLLNGSICPSLIVVVDNASHDGSPEQVVAAFPQIVMLRNQSNAGFTGGNNRAIEYLLQRDVDYVWILNNDTLVAKDCLEMLLCAAQSHFAAGYSAKIFYEMPPDKIWYAGAYRHSWHGAPKHETSGMMDATAQKGVVSVDFISGCCMLCPASILHEYGAFVTSYIAYSEDSDWCWRVRSAGMPLYYVPSAILWHRLSASLRKNTARYESEQITPVAAYLMVRNHFWTVRRHVQQPRLSLYLAVNTGIQFRNLLFFAMSGRWSLAKATARGFVSGLIQPVPSDIPDRSHYSTAANKPAAT